jgi:hypothetical protein
MHEPPSTSEHPPIAEVAETEHPLVAMVRQQLQEGIQLVPVYMRAAVTGYVLDGRPVGDFLTALLANDLLAAARHADDANLVAFGRWARLVYQHMPSQCHGSYHIVCRWIAAGGARGHVASAAQIEEGVL